MDNIELYIWLFCLDNPDTYVTRLSNLIEIIFATSKYIFPNVFIDICTIRRSLDVVIC